MCGTRALACALRWTLVHGHPARRGRTFCHFHDAFASKRDNYSLPIIEDATSLQFAVMQVIRALADKAIEHKTASLMLYGLQIASMNLKRFHNEHFPADDPEREMSLAEVLLERLGLEDEIPRFREECEKGIELPAAAE